MIIGVPKEIKENENRVAMLPAGVGELTRRGHRVLVQATAGIGSGIADTEFEQQDAVVVATPEQIFAEADMIVKVKEPLANEVALLRENQIVFTYFHFASNRELTEGVLARKCIAIAYETLTDAQGRLPLLTPMSEVAGRMSVQQGAKYLEKPQGGSGVLLGGVPGVLPATVMVLGGGVVGANAALMAAGMGANVIIFDTNLDRLRYLSEVMPKNVTTLCSSRTAILDHLPTTDLVIGAVLIHGAKAPFLILRDDLKTMRAGSVVVDVAIDQGGCIETSRPTSHAHPIFVENDVIHYCVTNMPGAVPRTSTFALCNATFPWGLKLAEEGIDKAATTSSAVALAVNTYRDELTCRGVADAFGLPFSDRFVKCYWKS